ncbi:glycosyltransferase family 4 protein [Formosa sp. L2A11]|uniref:glycosyltransferase family 4 protein n=1 Tax=Formosa sp. L2A11 TaxID=2686363 RepID=UPI00131B846F|nr:glycosyltransferase family 4 protein [Formosa sp. L2A11]
MTKVILLSQFPLPYHKIGSWTTMYKNYLESNHNIDYIVCEKPEFLFKTVNYGFVNNSLPIKIKKKLQRNYYLDYIYGLNEIIKQGEKYIIQVIDNFGIVEHLNTYLEQKGVRENCYIQFFFHGYSCFYKDFESRSFFKTIDEMVLLTQDSYRLHKNYYTILPTRFSVLHNGIDTTKFYKVTSTEKLELKETFKSNDKTIFVWCSQDRPKKGLHLILDVWKRLFKERKNIELWVIGVTSDKQIVGVRFIGRVPNDDLPKYYQAADCYLFPTLWQEGFGLSLIEALHCGCYCIASKIGGVTEVLDYGRYGKLIDNPHFINSWVAAIHEFLNEPLVFENISKEKYSMNQWNLDMNTIISEAKINI